MERATLEEGRQDGMARVRAAAARTTGTTGGGAVAVVVVERAALGPALLSLGDEMEPVVEAEWQEVDRAAEEAEVEAAKAEEEAALSSATEINAICVVCEKQVAPLNNPPLPSP